MVDTSDEWITSRTGIRTRHWCTEDESAATLAIAAARQALDRSGLAPADIACCVCATLSAPDATPSVACQVQAALGLPEDRPALDINAACSGFLYGMAVARGLLATLGGQYALVIGCEALSRLMDPADRTTCVLFGDGAGAAVLTASEEPGILGVELNADGRHQPMLNVPAQVANGEIVGTPYLHMDGGAVFKFAVKTLSDCASKALAAQNMSHEQLDWLVPHQANVRIIESTAKHLHLPMDKVVLTLPEQGNTSAASIPLALDVAVRDGRIQPGHTVMLEGIGGGFAWGAALVKM
jgi:3-oxoacyl-[acyl-carrier-protein] synthase-3